MSAVEPTRLIGDYVIPAEGDGEVLINGAIDIGDDGRIRAIGTVAELGPAPGASHTVGGLLMPGLVNAHAHTPMTLVRSAGDGLPLQSWLTEAIWPREGNMSPEDAGWGMTLGSAEMLLAGVTTSCEMYFFEDELVEAVKQTGGRMVLTPGVVSALLPGGDVMPRIEELDTYYQRHHDPAGRITVGFAPHSPYDLSADQVAEIARQAQARNALLHIHLEETEAERQMVLEREGCTATQMLADAGVLEGPVLAAHGVWLDDADQRLLREAGASLAHCPISNLKLGSGIAPTSTWLASGLNVAIGTDGVASNDNLDLWEELKLAPLLARGSSMDPGALSAVQAVDLATRAGGRALLVPDVGHLREGAWADIIRVDLDHPAFVPGLVDDLFTHLVFAGGSRHVTDVWVGGNPVVTDRQIVTVDLDEAIGQCRQRGARLTG